MAGPTIFESPDSQVVDAFQGRAADAADQRVAIAANQRVGHGPGARGAVKFRGVGHGLAYLAASILSTLIVLVLASSVPVTVTFFAANLAGVSWSLKT